MNIIVYQTPEGTAFKTKVDGEDSNRLYQAMNDIKPFLDDGYPTIAIVNYLRHLLPQDTIVIE